MTDKIPPESRMFRIGRECYVIYLGSNKDDIRPFLRIGNKPDIPNEIHDWVSNTIVTDNHLGNPLIETMDARRFHGRYLGDKEIVVAIRQFFKSFNLADTEVTDYEHVEHGEGRDVVYFYSDGNIRLQYYQDIIFDLQRRQKEDGHYIRLFELAKMEFQRNPLRYLHHDLSGKGIVFCGKDPIWYEDGNLLAFDSNSGFVTELMTLGVDPDFIQGIACNITSDEVNSLRAATYIGLVKRKRKQKAWLDVFTEESEFQRKISLLFPERDDVPQSIQVKSLAGNRRGKFGDSRIASLNGSWKLTHDGLPALVLGEGRPNEISVDSKRRKISMPTRNMEFSLPAGVPVNFLNSAPSDSQLVERYFSGIYNNIRDQLNNNQIKTLTEAETLLRQFQQNSADRGRDGIQVLEQKASELLDNLKACASTESELMWFLVSNINSLTHYLSTRYDGFNEVARVVDMATTDFLARMPHEESILPFLGDLYLGVAKPCLLWRSCKRNFMLADVKSAKMIASNITEDKKQTPDKWKSDQDRLLRLIRSLQRGGEGPLTAEQVAMLKDSNGKRNKSPGKSQAKREATPLTPAEKIKEKSSPARPLAGMGFGGGDRVPVKRRSARWLWLLLLPLLLLLGLAVVWDMSDSAPWGKSVIAPLIGVDTQDSAGDGSVYQSSQAPVSAGEQSLQEQASSPTDDADAQGVPDSTVDDSRRDDNLPPVDPDVVPKTEDDVTRYLNVKDRVQISEADIHLAANRIAVLSGYRDLEYRVFTGESPDWIYPGNILRLSEEESHVVESGDTVWFLAARELRLTVQNELRLFDEAVVLLGNLDTDEQKRNSSVDIIREIASNSPVAGMRELASEALKRR